MAQAGFSTSGAVRFSQTVALSFALALVFVTASIGPASAADCANESFREEQGVTRLPACMALEMVSPPNKFVEPASAAVFSVNGERIRFRSLAGLAETPGLPPVIALTINDEQQRMTFIEEFEPVFPLGRINDNSYWRLLDAGDIPRIILIKDGRVKHVWDKVIPDINMVEELLTHEN